MAGQRWRAPSDELSNAGPSVTVGTRVQQSTTSGHVGESHPLVRLAASPAGVKGIRASICSRRPSRFTVLVTAHLCPSDDASARRYANGASTSLCPRRTAPTPAAIKLPKVALGLSTSVNPSHE